MQHTKFPFPVSPLSIGVYTYKVIFVIFDLNIFFIETNIKMQKKAFTLIFSWAYNVSTILHYLHQVSANVSDRAKKITRGAFRLLYWDKGGWEIKGREIVTAAFMFSRDRNQFRPCAVWTHATAFCDIVVLFLINLRLQIYVWRFFFCKVSNWQIYV